MFKRVTKRERKREKEEELGLGEEMKQVLGLQETDSDESLGSTSDSEPDDYSDAEFDTGEDIDGEDDGDDDSDEDGPPMSVMAATTDPVYDLPRSPPTLNLRACIICPGKVIKNPKMEKTHLESSAHRRRLKHYTAEVSKRTSSGEGLNADDPRDILRNMSGNANYGAQVSASNRSQRRIQWQDKQAKRKKSQKEKRKMALDKSKEMDRQKSDTGGATKKVKKGENDGSRTGVSGSLVPVGSPSDPKAADKPLRESFRSGPIEPNLDDGQHIRPKKRQKR